MPILLDFPIRTEAQELMEAEERVRLVRERAERIAEDLYNARAVWIGGVLLPWGAIGEKRQQVYITEVIGLIQGE